MIPPFPTVLRASTSKLAEKANNTSVQTVRKSHFQCRDSDKLNIRGTLEECYFWLKGTTARCHLCVRMCKGQSWPCVFVGKAEMDQQVLLLSRNCQEVEHGWNSSSWESPCEKKFFLLCPLWWTRDDFSLLLQEILHSKESTSAQYGQRMSPHCQLTIT